MENFGPLRPAVQEKERIKKLRKNDAILFDTRGDKNGRVHFWKSSVEFGGIALEKKCRKEDINVNLKQRKYITRKKNSKNFSKGIKNDHWQEMN